MLGFGVGISHCGIRGGVSDAPDFSGSAAKALLAGESQGLAFDFTDSSAYIIDTGTPANNYDSTGIVSNGSLVGPSGKLTYTSPSNKLTLQSDGVMRYQAHNLYLNSAAPANQSITVVSGASYAVTITGTVSVTASGAATGTWTAGTNTFTAATTTLTLGSTSGSGTVHVRRTPSNDDYIATAGAAKYALPLEYSATDGSCLGLLVEEQRTNLCLYSNDLTQAGSWTASNMTTAKTATGPDNVANSATTITATAGNATVLQAITSASAARVTSVFIKRRTGTGNIDLTQDNGSTWTTQAVDSTWTRFSLSSVTSANPTVGIRIVTSGDAVDVALFSHEVGAFVTSPIITYGAAASRLADNISIATSAFPFSATVGSLYTSAIAYNATSQLSNSDAPTTAIFSNGGSSDRIGIRRLNASNSVNGLMVDGGSVVQNASTGTWANGADKKAAQAWQANDAQIVFDGTAGTQDTSVTLPTITILYIGSAYDGARGHWNAPIKAISYVPRRKSDAELQAETA